MHGDETGSRYCCTKNWKEIKTEHPRTSERSTGQRAQDKGKRTEGKHAVIEGNIRKV